MAEWIVPVAGPISSGFGKRLPPAPGASNFHMGVDIAASNGSPVVAQKAGVVVFAGLAGGFGGMVRINHDGAHETYAAHLSRIGVQYGQRVAQGQVVGASGGSEGQWGAGVSTGPHCHVEHRINGTAVDPAPYWSSAPAGDDYSPILIVKEDKMSALAIFRSIRVGVGEFLVYASPAQVMLSRELSTIPAADRDFEFRVAQSLALAAGLGAAYEIPVIDDSQNGGWYLLNQIAGRIAGMPADYPLSSTNPFTPAAYYSDRRAAVNPAELAAALAPLLAGGVTVADIESALKDDFASVPDAVRARIVKD